MSHISTFKDILSFATAAAIWNLDDSTLRKAVATGRLKKGQDCSKYGKQWVVTTEAMCRVYGIEKYLEWMDAGKPAQRRRKQPQQLEGQTSLTLSDGPSDSDGNSRGCV